MQPANAEAKSQLRERVLARLRTMTAVARRTGSTAVCEQLPRLPVWREAASILFYAPFKGELDVWPLVQEALAEGKVVGLPRFDFQTRSYAAFQVRDLEREIQTGYYAIREPVPGCPAMPLNRLDLMLVPGIAFDLHGRRLGRGKGFYDRLMAELGGRACGIAFDEQVVDAVPVEPHDRLVNCVLTPTRWIVL